MAKDKPVDEKPKERKQRKMATKAMTAGERQQQVYIGELLRSANRFANMVKDVKKGAVPVDDLIAQWNLESSIQKSIIDQMKGGNSDD